MIRTLAALMLALGAGQAMTAPPQPQTAPQTTTPSPNRWMVSDSQAALVDARIAFPREIGTLHATRTQEFSHPGDGMDNALQYESADRTVFGTAYVYYPGLAHSGLAAFTTDEVIRQGSGVTLIGGRMRIVPAGGTEGLAIRADYSGYRDGLASSVAFIKAGRWIVKLRVSGPEARRAEVEAAMTALLAGIRFGVQNPPFPATPLTVAPCAAGTDQRDAHLLPDPPGAELAAHAFLATFDGGGNLATDEHGARRDLPSRVPEQLCLSRLQLRTGSLPLLRGPEGEARSVDGRTMVLVSLSDSGNTLEVVHAANLHRYLLLYHEIGRTSLLGGYDGVPSDRQLAALLNDPQSEAGRIRVPVQFRASGGPEIYLPGLPAGANPPPAH